MEERPYYYEAFDLSNAMDLQYFSSLCINSKGEVAVFDEEKEKIRIFDNKGALLREIPDTFKGIMALAYDDEDKLYTLFQNQNRNGSEVTGMIMELAIYDQQGQRLGDEIVREIKGNAESLKGKYINKMMIDKKGDIYVLKGDGTVEVLDKNLNTTRNWDRAEYSDFAIDYMDNIILLQRNTGGKSYLQKINLQNDKFVWEKELKNVDAPEHIYCNLGTGKLYGIQNGVIFTYDFNGDIEERLLDIKELSAFDYIDGFIVDDEEVIYVQNYNGKKSSIISFIKQDKNQKSASEVDKKRLTIYVTYYADNIFSNVALQYEKEHPDVDIEINVISEMSDKETIKKLNTELMAGKGPDIIFSDFLLTDYIEKGILVNLEEFINKNESFNIEDYNENLINASKAEYGFYCLPVDYSINCFLVNTKLMEQKGIVLKEDMTWEQLYNIVVKANSSSKEKFYILPKMEHEELYYYIIYEDINYYIDKENKVARFDSQEFMQALELMRRMVDGKLLHPDLDVKKIIRSDGELAPEDILFIPISFYSYKHIWTYGMYYDGFHIIPEIRGLSTDIREVNARSIAINSNSQYKGEACEFIKLFLSEEVQYKLSESNDLPVNKKADEKSMADMLRETNEIPPEWYRPTEKDIGHLKGYMAKINKISSYDQELDKLIWNEIEKYMKNEKSVEETAKAVQNKVELYLNE
ncbi:ABC-type glycerol-3-phosphate transport system, substrate-binding protein [Lutispora thermophila DSM 19022]|uniref:ABC-type glycerol-3-phosphate transport system, substrate-binding protein n=2 Tax=Lutispora TaxID=667112 RepID=A0A1M6DLF3_9FIRM|nr:ABC-type glycerol-3-phosphate transport system, substrate-binding protein [Lutispora thermophila DSM 19022]